MAKKVLPRQEGDIDAVVAEYRQRWEANMDAALADKIMVQENQSAHFSREKSSQSQDEAESGGPETVYPSTKLNS